LAKKTSKKSTKKSVKKSTKSSSVKKKSVNKSVKRSSKKKSRSVSVTKSSPPALKKKRKDNHFGVASLALGILSILFSIIPFLSLIAGILGIVFAVKQKKTWYSVSAKAGLITSIVGIVITLVLMFFRLLYILTIVV